MISIQLLHGSYKPLFKCTVEVLNWYVLHSVCHSALTVLNVIEIVPLSRFSWKREEKFAKFAVVLSGSRKQLFFWKCSFLTRPMQEKRHWLTPRMRDKFAFVEINFYDCPSRFSTNTKFYSKKSSGYSCCHG